MKAATKKTHQKKPGTIGGAAHRKPQPDSTRLPEEWQMQLGNKGTQARLGEASARQMKAEAPTNKKTDQPSANGKGSGGGAAMPSSLRNGLENLSGMDLSGVQVHYNSPKPAQVNALAYTQGQDIHVAPEQEKHLPHEGWHVVQQMQGRVNPTIQTKGILVNNDISLEQEADVMGRKSLQKNLREPPQISNAPQLPKGDLQSIQKQCDPSVASCPQPNQSTDDDISALNIAGDVSAGTGSVVSYEAALRKLYQQADEAIFNEAELMLKKGMNPKDVAQWSVNARNNAKVAIRKWDLDIVRLMAEQRNTKAYGNPVGPTYEQLRYGDPARNIPPRTDNQIIESAGKSNLKVNRWTGRLRIAGRIMIAIDIGIGIYNVISAPEVDRPRVLMQETGRIAGALAGGVAGAKVGGWIGAGIGAWFGVAGAAPGAAIGAILGGIGGAIGGAWAGNKLGDLLADQLYPPQQTDIAGSFQ